MSYGDAKQKSEAAGTSVAPPLRTGRITGRLFVAAHPVLARPDAALAELRHIAHFVVFLEVTAGQRALGLHQVDLALRFRVLLP